MYKRFIKRILDIFLSSIALIILALPMFFIAIAIKIDSPGPVMFKQKRIGIHKTYFNIFKFRTMYTSTPNDIPTHLLHDSSTHITKIGKFLRKTSLDELPQFINIFIGNMSLVGPRPALWNQYDLIEERDKYGANDVKPGLTGWAQVNGRDELEIPIKAKYDGEYIVKQSFMFDIKCILATIASVFKAKGIVEGSKDANVNLENKEDFLV